MKKADIALVITGSVIILFAAFCPSIIAEVHRVSWRITIGLTGCFSLVSGMYRIVCKKGRR